LDAILERSKFGIAMAAMIKMIATTINNSINEKPFSLLCILTFSLTGLEFFREAHTFDPVPGNGK